MRFGDLKTLVAKGNRIKLDDRDLIEVGNCELIYWRKMKIFGTTISIPKKKQM